MRKLGLLAVLVVGAGWLVASRISPNIEGPIRKAHAGEILLGKMVVIDAGTTTNRCTGWSGYSGGGAFTINPKSLISIQCDAAAYVLTDVAGCDAGTCVAVQAGQFFTTSVNASKTLLCKAYNSDGGTAGHAVTYTGGWVAMAPAAASATCFVYERNGGE